MEELISLFKLLIKKKKYWLIPLVFVLFFVGSLIFFTQGTALSPFIYTLF